MPKHVELISGYVKVTTKYSYTLHYKGVRINPDSRKRRADSPEGGVSVVATPR